MKLNCSFPWNNLQYHKKCGSKEKVKNLVNIVNQASFQDASLMKEIIKFGCTIENCQSTNWEISSSQWAALLGSTDYIVNLNFPSLSEVIFFLNIHIQLWL